MSKTKIKIYGAAFCGNVGDDLIAFVLRKYLQDHFSDSAEVTVIPQQKQHEEIMNADVLIIGGGGLIYDYDMNNVRNYCDAIHTAYSYRVPTYMMGMGVQNVFSDEAKSLYREELPKLRAIATRGTMDSQFIIDDLSFNPNRVVTSRDLVFLYDDVVGKKSHEERSHSKPVLALSLADWKLGKSYEDINKGLNDQYKEYRKYLDEKLPLLKDVFDVKVVCQAREDAEICKYLADVFGTEVVSFGSPEDSTRLVDVYREADYVISNRYHGLIAAIIAGTPVLGVSYSTHKTQRLISDSFPSIESQFYTIGDFVSDDILSRMMESDYRESICQPTQSEYDDCVKWARKHAEILKYIAGDIARQ